MSIIGDEARKDVSEYLSEHLPDGGKAKLLTFGTRNDSAECQYCDEVKQLADELASISGGRVVAEHHLIEDSSELASRLKVKRVPATVVTDQKAQLSMKFYGIPSGHEFMALLEDVVEAAGGQTSKLSETTVQTLQKVTKPLHIQVFVTPDCPYCPRAVRMAHKFSLVNPAKIDAEMIESMEFPELAEKYSVMAVPKVVINDSVEFEGALPEQVFLFKVKEALREGQQAEHAGDDKGELETAMDAPTQREGAGNRPHAQSPPDGKVLDLDDSNFSTEVSKYPLMLIDFWAPWCMPCKMVSPAVDQLAKQYSGRVAFGRVNTDENPATANEFGIQGIPTLMLFKYGKMVDQLVGAYPKNIIDSRIREHLGSARSPSEDSGT